MGVAAIGGSVTGDLYVTLMEMQAEQRTAARAMRRAEQEGEIDSLMSAADHAEQAAVWGALSTAVQGAADGGGGIASAVGGGGGQAAAIQGGGKVMSAPLELMAGLEQAAAERSRASAKAHGSAAQDARDVEERAQEIRQGLLRRLEQADETRNAATMAALRA